jgi:diguanylate cyclase (GGDEF)-like protein
MSGIVVAHSSLDELGKNYLEDADSLGGAIARKILDEKQMQFDLKMDEGNYSVYVDQLQGGWYSVSLIDSDVWYRPLQRTTLLFSIILVVIVVFLCFVFLRLNAKNQALQRLHSRVDQEEKRGNEFQMLSETDRMTGLYDRVCGEHKVEDLLALGTGGMFLVLDIDHFKSFNDTYGHQYGDQVILAVADALRSTFRANDITMRLGGDEFGVFAVGIADRAMGEAIIRRLFDHLDAVEIAELRKEKFSISVGAALWTGHEDLTFDKLYAAADSAMYASKKISGNSFAFSG